MGKTSAADKGTAPQGDAEPTNVTPIDQGKKPKAAADTVSSVGDAEKPALVVFGRDEAKKAHASTFTTTEAELAERAAGTMGFRVLRLTTPEHHAAAQGLAQGRIFASGRAFSPFCKEAAYAALEACGDAFQPAPPPAPEPPVPPAVTGTPQRWEDLAVGALVLASTGDAMAGWFESVIVEDRGEGLFVLVWRDFVDDPPFARRVDGLALLPAEVAA